MLRIIVKSVVQVGPDTFEEKFKTFDMLHTMLEDFLKSNVLIGVEIISEERLKGVVSWDLG